MNLLVCPLRRWGVSSGLKGWGLLVLHLGALVLLVGAGISFAMAKHALVELGVGDRLDLAEYSFSDLALSLERFEIQYYSNLEPKQFTSTVNLESADGEARQGKVSVNHPLEFQGIKLYQSRWGWLVKGEVTIGEEAIPFEVESGKPLALNQGQTLYLVPQFVPDLNADSPVANNPGLFCRLMRGHEVIAKELIKLGETKSLQGYSLSFQGYRYLSGLEVKRDPGLPVVYTGFGLLGLGLILARMRKGRPSRQAAQADKEKT